MRRRPSHAGLDRGLQHVEGAVGEHLEREPRLLRALRDADGRLMEDDIDAVHRLGQQRAVTNVALDDA